MKSHRLALTLVIICITAIQNANADSSWVEFNSADRCQETQLLQRINRLEQEVQHLQRKLHYMEYRQRDGLAQHLWTCTIETAFDGDFVATAPSKREATIKVVRDCRANNGSHCGEFWTKCEEIEF